MAIVYLLPYLTRDQIGGVIADLTNAGYTGKSKIWVNGVIIHRFS